MSRDHCLGREISFLLVVWWRSPLPASWCLLSWNHVPLHLLFIPFLFFWFLFCRLSGMVMSFSFAWAWANTLATISPVSVFLSYSSVICCPLAFSSFSALTSLLNLLVSLSMSRIAIFSLQLRPCQFQFSSHELFFLFLKLFFFFSSFFFFVLRFLRLSW